MSATRLPLDLDRIERIRQRYEEHPPPPLSEEQSRILLACFGKLDVRRRAA